MAEVAGWTWERNVPSFPELVSHCVGYDFDGTLLSVFADG